MPRPHRPLPPPEIMRQVAKWSFEEGKKNYEIAELLHKQGHLPNPKNTKHVEWALEEAVKWLLCEERQLEQMRQIKNPLHSLEQQLRDKFRHLQEVRILPLERNYAAMIRQWGRTAAAYLDELIKDENICDVGVSGGQTILEVMSQLPDIPRPNVTFYAIALIGQCRLRESSHVSPEVNATIGWARSGREPGKCLYSSASPYDPALAKCKPAERRESIKDHLKELSENKQIQSFMRDLDHLQIIFAGLGDVNPLGTNPARRDSDVDRLTMTGLLKPLGIETSELAAQGAVGDLSYCLFNAQGKEEPMDRNGRPLPKDHWRFFVTAGHYDSKHSGVEFYRHAVEEGETKVAVIAGVHKEGPLLAALRGQLFNVWFTDEQTARHILIAK